MASIATNTADDAGCVVLALGAVVLAMANLSTILASLVLVVSEGTVEGGKFTKLVALEFVLSLWNGCGLESCQSGFVVQRGR